MSSNKRVSMVSSQHQLGPRIPTLQIFNSITGETLLTNAYNFTTFDNFKGHVSSSFNIPVDNLFLLTPFGIKLKFSMLIREETTEIYVFDRRLISKDIVPEEIVQELNNRDLISMIKPMASPLNNEDLKRYVDSLRPVLKNSSIKSKDISLNDLRLLLNSLKRNTGWAAALLSDFRKTVCSSEGELQEGKETAAIVASLNVLLQYLNILTGTLQREFAETVDQLESVKKNALNESWRSYLDVLQRIRFSVAKSDLDSVVTIRISELLDERNLLAYSQQSTKAMRQTTESLGKLRMAIEREILSPKSKLNTQYDDVRTEYLQPSSELAMTEAENEGFQELEGLVSQITYHSKSLPSFEELITTASATSADLSAKAIEKIHMVVDLYTRSSGTMVPRIIELADQLYQKQLKKILKRQKLQSQIMSTSFVTAGLVSLNVSKARNSLNNSVKNSMEEFRNAELRLSIVKDLPILFGSWLVANMKRLKWVENVQKIAYRTNEIFELIKFNESSTRSRWIEAFSLDQMKISDSPVAEGSNALFALSDSQKKKFVEEHLLSPKVVLTDGSISRGNSRANSPPPQPLQPEESNQHDRLLSLGKVMRKINTNVVQTYNFAAQQAQTRGLTRKKDIWEVIADFVSLNDIMNYLRSLRECGYNMEIVSHLFSMLQEFGADQNLLQERSPTRTFESLNALGTLDGNDPSFVRQLREFVKNFEMEGFKILITQNEKSIDGEKDASSEVTDSLLNNTKNNEKLIRGYEARIRTLENLLHQHSFRKFNDQVIRSPSPRPKITSTPSHESRKASSRSGSTSPLNVPISNTLLFENGFPQIGERKSPVPREVSSKINELNSTNQSLNDEVSRLRTELRSRSQSVNYSSSLSSENTQLKQELEEMRALNRQMQMKLQDSEVEHERELSRNRESLTSSFETTISSLRMEISGLRDENDRLTSENKHWRSQYEEVNTMKKDVLANMTEKESAYNREIMQFQQEISDLKLKIDDLEDDGDEHIVAIQSDLESQLQSKDTIIVQLDRIVELIYAYFKELTEELASNLALCCVILESVGLLMIREPSENETSSIKIRRVKGLREKRKVKMTDTNVESSDVFAEISSEVLNETEKYSPLIRCEPLENDIFSNLLKHGKSGDESEGDVVNKANNDFLDAFDIKTFDPNFRNFMKFTRIDKATKLMISERIAKRFRDVEQLARTLQKECNQHKSEISSLNHVLSQCIKVRNFKLQDVVLFLPTRDPVGTEGSSIDTDKNVNLESIDQQNVPWAVFNIGAPHYYLTNYQRPGEKKSTKNHIDLTGREWILARILRIEEKHVTAENVSDSSENPFSQGLGTTWFAVEAKEETLVKDG